MSEEAEKPDEDEKPEVVEGEEPQEGDKPEEDEAEIVLAGEEGSQPENKNLGIRRRINKLNAKVAEARESQTATATELEVERERNRLLSLALEQREDESPDVPDPNEYDDGVADPKYVADLQKHITKGVHEEIKKSQPQPVQDREPDIRAKQEKHYARADALKVRDYDSTEDKAIEILGQDIVNQVIANTEKSAELLFFLGKNPDRAESIRDLIAENPLQGVLEIGKLEARLSVKPKANSEPAPDPDTELEGGTSPKPNLSDYERKLEKMRAKVQTGGQAEVDALFAFKKEHAARAK